jgi:signal transduction histidine kinase
LFKILHFEKEYERRLWKSANTVFWSIIALIFFTVATDFILLKKNWFDYVALKVLLIVFFYLSYNFFNGRYKKPNLLIHIVFFSFNLFNLISITEADYLYRVVYITILTTSFILFNSLIIWSAINSFFQYILIIISFFILINVELVPNPSEILKEGGYVFLSAGFLSLYFPRMKEVILKQKIADQIKTNERLFFLENEVHQTKSQYLQLLDKMNKKDNESKFLFQQISNDLNKINEVLYSENFSDSLNNKEKNEKLISLVENLRNQSSIYFKPINSNSSVKFSKEPVDLKLIYKLVFKSFIKEFQLKELNLTEEFSNTKTVVYGEEKIFKTIFFNILNFITIYSKKGDEIEVQFENQNNNTIFKISNKTNGLNSLEIESFFRDLEYVNYDYKKHSDSVKIGLRISKQLTQKMNGYFSYVSSEKLGFEMKLQFKTHK